MPKGLYLLLIRVDSNIQVRVRGAPYNLQPGYYLYIGSGGGPGGVNARIRRHLVKKKSIHWHIDQITTNTDAHIIKAWICNNSWGLYMESRVALCLEKHLDPGPPGFGSSDDRHAKTHLFNIGISYSGLEPILRRCCQDLLEEHDLHENLGE